MLLNLRPLIIYRDYRLLLLGQTVSFLGSMITYVAIPWQVYELTHSTYLVGMLGVVQLAPLLFFAVIGGSVADRMDRRALLLISEGVMSLGILVLAFNASLPSPSVSLIFFLAAFLQAANGFHRPAMDAMVQKMVEPQDYAAVGALGAIRFSVGAIVGPALGGTLIAAAGVHVAYLFDFFTFFVAVISIALIRKMPAPEKLSETAGILEGFRYAWKRPQLMGTYIVDIIAMTFAFPTALFPAMGETWGGAKATGLLFSSMAAGSLIVTVLSGWTSKVRRHGRWVILSAAFWGLSIIALGFAPNLPIAILCLSLAGAADCVSAIFRQVIWNESIPNHIRGRMAGIEMISYMTGPLLGNARSGWVAAKTSVPFSILSGGVLCTLGVLLCIVALPSFWAYRSPVVETVPPQI